METVKRTPEYTVYKKRSGRYAVVNSKEEFVKADEKVKILLKEKLIKLTPPKKKEEAKPAEGAAAEQKA